MPTDDPMPVPPFPPRDDVRFWFTVQEAEQLAVTDPVGAPLWAVVHGWFEGYLAATGEKLRPGGPLDATWLLNAFDALEPPYRANVLGAAEGWVRLSPDLHIEASGRGGVIRIAGKWHPFVYVLEKGVRTRESLYRAFASVSAAKAAVPD